MKRSFRKILASIVTAVFATLFLMAIIHKKRQRAMIPYINARQFVWKQVDPLIANIDLLRMSSLLEENLPLLNCLFIDGSCSVTSANQQADIVLLKNFESGERLTGTTTQPVAYDALSGEICNKSVVHSNSLCDGWQVVTSFWATCPDNQSFCEQAEILHMRLSIRPSETYDWPDFPAAMPPLDEYYDHPEKFAYSVAIRSAP